VAVAAISTEIPLFLKGRRGSVRFSSRISMEGTLKHTFIYVQVRRLHNRAGSGGDMAIAVAESGERRAEWRLDD
jgi:hypothetical protein